MAKRFHPDESRFIRVQAAYELLMDRNQRQQYDLDHRQNPMQASRAWREWVLKKKAAFEQRGDMAVGAWAEQQQREMSLRARRLSKQKMDPEEERRLLARERQASTAAFETTLKRHNLVLRKRDLMKHRSDESARRRLVQDLLAAEGYEVESEEDTI
eukprot:SM000245S08195  [mRNA]  locus=s245:64374:65957:- [translate_table: standard]